MEPSVRPSIEPSKVSAAIHQKLNMYALAASAAGVSMLALAQPADGEIVYTRAHKSIAPNTTLHLDLNHDGTKDFDLRDTFSQSNYTSSGRLIAVGDRKQNHVWGHTAQQRPYASALFAGVRIGPKGQFLPGSGLMAQTTFNGGRSHHPGQESCTAPWANVTNRYLGLKFLIAGKVHFGWARLNVSCGGQHVNATLTGYAYETVPDRPITTGKKKSSIYGSLQHGSAYSRSADPQPVSLGRLAQGAEGLAGRRPKQ